MGAAGGRQHEAVVHTGCMYAGGESSSSSRAGHRSFESKRRKLKYECSV